MSTTRSGRRSRWKGSRSRARASALHSCWGPPARGRGAAESLAAQLQRVCLSSPWERATRSLSADYEEKKRKYIFKASCWKCSLTFSRTSASLHAEVALPRLGSRASQQGLPAAWGKHRPAACSTLLHHVSQGLSGSNSRWSSSISQ